jgi:hypothetical protein
MSLLNSILDDIVSTVGSVPFNSEAVPCVKRKLPKKEETVDVQTQSTVSGEELVDRIKRIGFGSCWQCLYRVQITLVTPNDRDQLYHMVEHTDWREGVRALFQKPKSVAGAKRVEFVNSPMFDRGELANGYDYDQLTLEVTTYERRT